MRSRLSLLVAAVLLAGCDQTNQPAEPSTVDSPSLAQSPDERTIVERFDETATFFDECFGEDVLVEFHRQIVTFFRGEETHGHFHVTVTELGSTVTGLTSGTVWTLHGTQVLSGNGDFTADDTPGEFTALLNHTLISPGTDVNLRLRERFHITITPDETVAVERSTFEAVCR